MQTPSENKLKNAEINILFSKLKSQVSGGFQINYLLLKN